MGTHRDHISCTVGRKMLSHLKEICLQWVGIYVHSALSSQSLSLAAKCDLVLQTQQHPRPLLGAQQWFVFSTCRTVFPLWVTTDWLDPPSVSFCSFSFPSSSVHHSLRHSIQCLVSSSFTRAALILVEYLCVICISPLLWAVISQLHPGRLVPKSNLCRWARVLLI